jgi:uncharacterized protein Smg (DUF494 family)
VVNVENLSFLSQVEREFLTFLISKIQAKVVGGEQRAIVIHKIVIHLRENKLTRIPD